MQTEPDPLGTDAGKYPSDPGGGSTDTGTSDIVFPRYADAFNLAAGCEWDGMPISCDLKASTDEFDKQYWDMRARLAEENHPRADHEALHSRDAVAGGAGHSAGAFSGGSDVTGSSGSTSTENNTTTSSVGPNADNNADIIYGPADARLGQSYVTVRASLFDDTVDASSRSLGLIELVKI